MRKSVSLALLVLANLSIASVVIGSPDLASMDPFCTS